MINHLLICDKTKESPVMTDHRQSGGILVKFAVLMMFLSLCLIIGGVIYLGSAELPPPTTSVQIPVPDNAIQRQ